MTRHRENTFLPPSILRYYIVILFPIIYHACKSKNDRRRFREFLVSIFVTLNSIKLILSMQNNNKSFTSLILRCKKRRAETFFLSFPERGILRRGMLFGSAGEHNRVRALHARDAVARRLFGDGGPTVAGMGKIREYGALCLPEHANPGIRRWRTDHVSTRVNFRIFPDPIILFALTRCNPFATFLAKRCSRRIVSVYNSSWFDGVYWKKKIDDIKILTLCAPSLFRSVNFLG